MDILWNKLYFDILKIKGFKMPMCKNCNAVVGVGQLNKNGFCEKCLSTDEGQKQDKESTSTKELESTKDKKGSSMEVFLYILAVLAFINGFFVLSESQSAIHQILGYIGILIGAVFLSSGGIISAITSKDN